MKKQAFKQYRKNKRGFNRFIKSIGRAGKVFYPIIKKTTANSNINKKNTCIIDEFDLSEPLKFLFENKNFFTDKPAHIPKNGVLNVPKIFSLVESPKESFQFLKDLLYTLRYPKSKRIKINYKKCVRIDLDASICNDIILLEFINAFKSCNERKIILETRKINTENLINETVSKFLYAIGSHKIIGNKKIIFPNILTCDLTIGDKRKGIAYKDVESTKLVQHIEKCLIKMNKKLTQDARENFGEIIAEVIANAEEHNKTNFHYSIGHFEENTNNDKHIGKFQLVIFNFGESIYERFKNPEACKNQAILDDMRNLSDKYTKKGFFGFLNGSKFEEETLWTLYSLQDGVSSVDNTRGNGTIKFIENFLELADDADSKPSNFHLFSGNTLIKFDGKYKTYPKFNAKNEEFKIIPFNAENTLDEKPDQNYVKFVDNYFPGVMIYANICISKNDIIENEK